MRLWDVVFGCGAFVYVFLIGWRLAGTWAALVSVFLLFSFDPLVFEHGIRGNHMEAALLVAYCGGIYHFVRWTDGGPQRTRRLHALAVGAYLSLGFMTKFVAILFLPMVCVLAFALAPHTVPPLRRTWKDWLPSAALVMVVCAPWFVYQTIVTGRPFWDQIFLAHVYTRFTGTLVDGHLRPWDHYPTQLWLELRLARMALVVSVGALLLAVRAVWWRDWLSRVCLIWCLLPLALMSMGTSKLFYYVYPFFPPLALGGGLVAAAIASALERPYVRSLGERMAAGVRARGFSLSSRGRRVLAVIGAVALLLGLWTLVDGPVTFEVDGMRVFRNSSAVRVFVIGAIAWYMSGYGSRQLTPVAAALTLLFLPVGTYTPRVERFSSIDHPLQSVRDCAMAVQASGASPPTGFFRHSGAIHHGFTYYLRPLGPWLDVTAAAAESDELSGRIGVVGAHSPVVMSKEAFLHLARGSGAAVPPAVVIGGVVMVLPGPYETCVPRAINGGAMPVPPPA
jgi:4-amino-4-deoxy-L-arabinose transferase-like glycosyltransferase